VPSLIERIRTVPDFPEPGVLFRDLTPLMGDAAALREVAEALAAPFRTAGITRVAGMEARGFIFGALAAVELNAGFVPLRKPGKLPAAVEAVSYALEYGRAGLEVHRDAFAPTDRVLLVDDVLATGGTARASVDLLQRLGVTVVACAFVLELKHLAGRHRLTGLSVHTVLEL
jgi:adenine phosphoribosyltransferase